MAVRRGCGDWELRAGAVDGGGRGAVNGGGGGAVAGVKIRQPDGVLQRAIQMSLAVFDWK